MSKAVLGFATRPTIIFGSRRWAATTQIATTAGSMANAAHLNTRASLSPDVLHCAGTHRHSALPTRNSASEKIQFATNTYINARCCHESPNAFARGGLWSFLR